VAAASVAFLFSLSVLTPTAGGAQARSSDASLITVGPNVYVSEARPDFMQGELILDADPGRPGRLIACSLIFHPERSNKEGWGVVIYLSEDGGRGWAPTFEERNLMDPTCVYGVDGSAYLLAFVSKTGESDQRLYRSLDGGYTWEPPIHIRPTDRPYLTVDRTEGKYHGRIYSHGNIGSSRALDGPRPSSGIKLYTSADSGRTFLDPVQRWAPDPHYVLGVGNGVVLSDGTLLMLFGELRDYWNPDETGEIRESSIGLAARANARLRIVSSSDGGKTLSPATTVADYHMHAYPWRPPAGVIPWIAADATEGPFRDRLYVVWPDRRSGRDEIFFTYSTDKGESWSRPVAINDDRARFDPAGPDHFMPVVAVNKHGVVGVGWYDRRESSDNLGWHMRFTASLDGGETWLPSVRVSEGEHTFTEDTYWPVRGSVTSGSSGRPGLVELSVNQFLIWGGDTGGLVADPTGTFHMVWPDNRTGVAQLWSAAITVNGSGHLFGDPDIAQFSDLSDKVELELFEMTYDRSTEILSVQARLKNLSPGRIAGPLMVRVGVLQSGLGAAEILNGDNGLHGSGAVWDFTSFVPDGVLLPDAASRAKELRFRVSDVRTFLQGSVLKFGLVQFDVRILGKYHDPEP
jgi:hypothetical protein